MPQESPQRDSVQQESLHLLSDSWPYLVPHWRRSLPVAYLLWFFWGMLGAHKLYLGRPFMAMLYALTGGFFALGWALDLLTLPAQVAECNLRLMLEGRLPQERGPGSRQPWVPGWSTRLWRWLPRSRRRREGQLMTELLLAAGARGGVLSVTDAVMATGLPFDRARAVLSRMLSEGYVDVTNDAETGVVQYVFPELQRSLHSPHSSGR